MNSTKYIVIERSFEMVPTIFIFPASINHSDMAKVMDKLGFDTIISAGFVDEFLQCYGESSSLHKSSRKQDTNILHKMLEIEDKHITYTDL